MKMHTRTYLEVMGMAAGTKLVLAPEDRLAWRRLEDQGEMGGVAYASNSDKHVVIEDGTGCYVILNEGELLIDGAPTVCAAKTAADCALKMGLAGE